jgi:hypothetical protein
MCFSDARDDYSAKDWGFPKEVLHFEILISSHLISSHLISSHLISSHLISSHLISSHLISSHLISSFSISHLIHFQANVSAIFQLHSPSRSAVYFANTKEEKDEVLHHFSFSFFIFNPNSNFKWVALFHQIFSDLKSAQ